MITRCNLLIIILISFLPSPKGCFTTVAEEDFTAPITIAGVTTTFAETTTVETTTTLTPTTSTTSTTTTTTTTLPPCPALGARILPVLSSPPATPLTAFLPTGFNANTYPVGTTLTIQCINTPASTTAGNLGTSLRVKDDSGTFFPQDVDNGPTGGESFTLTCLPSGSYEVVMSTTSNPAQSAIISAGGTGFIQCIPCKMASPPICLSPTG